MGDAALGSSFDDAALIGVAVADDPQRLQRIAFIDQFLQVVVLVDAQSDELAGMDAFELGGCVFVGADQRV